MPGQRRKGKGAASDSDEEESDEEDEIEEEEEEEERAPAKPTPRQQRTPAAAAKPTGAAARTPARTPQAGQQTPGSAAAAAQQLLRISKDKERERRLAEKIAKSPSFDYMFEGALSALCCAARPFIRLHPQRERRSNSLAPA